MRKWHPDVNRSRDATIRTEEVNLAQAVLSCRESRYNHDIQLKEAGLSSKPLFKKSQQPCLECGCKGSIKVYNKDSWNKIKRMFGFKAQHEEKICLECCGTGWVYRIEEH